MRGQGRGKNCSLPPLPCYPHGHHADRRWLLAQGPGVRTRAHLAGCKISQYLQCVRHCEAVPSEKVLIFPYSGEPKRKMWRVIQPKPSSRRDQVLFLVVGSILDQQVTKNHRSSAFASATPFQCGERKGNELHGAEH